MKRRPKLFLTFGIALASGFVALLAAWFTGSFRLSVAERRWTEVIGDLDNAEAGARDLDSTARDLDDLARRLGIHLLRSGGVGPARPVAGPLRAWLANELRLVGEAVGPPPEDVSAWLAERADVLREVSDILRERLPPTWDFEPERIRLRQPPETDTWAVQELGHALLAAALAAHQGGEGVAANDLLEASWRVAASLDRPLETDVAARLRLVRLHAGALRRIEPSNSGTWRDRLAGADGLPSQARDALRLRAWLLHEMLTSADAWDAWEEHVEALEAVAARRGFDLPGAAGSTYREHRAATMLTALRRRITRLDEGSACHLSSVHVGADGGADGGAWRLTPSDADVARLADDLEALLIDTELTAKLLRLKEERDATGSWPSPAPWWLLSSRCGEAAWRYEVSATGEMYLAIHLDPPWTDAQRERLRSLPHRHAVVTTTQPAEGAAPSPSNASGG